MSEITSPQNPKLKKALQLHSSRGRKQQNRIIIFGAREIGRAIIGGLRIQELFTKGSQSDLLREVNVEKTTARIYELPGAIFEKLSFGDRGEKLVAIADRPSTGLKSITKTESAIVLSAIEKPGNIGAAIRSADGAGIKNVIIDERGSDFFHPNSIRSSMGSVFSMRLARESSEAIQDWLIQSELNVLLARVDGSTDFYSHDLKPPTAFVIGNEALGLDESWNREGFNSVHLPMNGIADSLNVSATAAVMVYEWQRQNNN